MKLYPSGKTISNRKEKCLKNDLLDIKDWVDKAIEGKINNCKKRMINEWMPKLMADPNVTEIPANEDALIDFITARPDYKNRVDREKEKKK